MAWDEKRKFMAETIRTVVFAVAGAIIAYLILDPIKAKSAYQAQIDREKLIIKTQLVNEFLNKSFMYVSIAADAYNHKEPQTTLYNGSVYDNYSDLRNRMEIYFSGKIFNQLVATDKLNDSMRNNMDKLPFDQWQVIQQRFKKQNNIIAREALNQLEM